MRSAIISRASCCGCTRQENRRPQALTEAEKDRLVATAKRDFETRRTPLVDLQREAGLGHVCPQTILTALNERGLK